MFRFIAAILLSALFLAAETDYRFAFPQSELLMGIDLKWLLKSPAAAKLKTEAKMADWDASLGDLKVLEGMLDQIENVYISAVSKAPAKAPKGRKAPSNNEQNTDLVILLKGKFKTEEIVTLAAKSGFRPADWGKVKVLLPVDAKPKPTAPGNTGPNRVRLQNAQFTAPFAAPNVDNAKPAVALLDEQTIVIAEEAPLRVALERMETGLKPQANPLFERARDLEAEHDLWIVGSMAPLNLNGVSGGSAGEKDPISEMMKQVRNFSLGMAMRRNMTLDLQLQTASPKVATEMRDMMNGFLAMAKLSQQEEDAKALDMDKALQLSASGNIVRASLTLEQSELDSLMAQALKVTAGDFGGEKTQDNEEAKLEAKAEAPKPVEPPKPERKTVMIFGLPDGPKEVPVN